MFNKPSVEVGNPEEALVICKIFWGFPTQDTGHLLRIHPDPLIGDDNPRYFTSCW